MVLGWGRDWEAPHAVLRALTSCPGVLDRLLDGSPWVPGRAATLCPPHRAPKPAVAGARLEARLSLLCLPPVKEPLLFSK